MPSAELQAVHDLLRQRAAAAATAGDADFPTRRAAADAMAAAIPADCTAESAELGGVLGDWVAGPVALTDAALLYLHGGGYVFGSVATHRALAAKIARASQLRTFVAGYRLAPEHRFPTAVDDSVDAFRALLAAGIPASRIALAGDSAGGGLAIATALRLRDLGEPLPGAIACITPWTDLTMSGPTAASRLDRDPITPGLEAVRGMGTLYMGSEPLTHPLASPINADLAGLPPLLIHAGTADVLFDDSTRLAARACEAGVAVTFEPWEEMFHIWHMWEAMLPEARQAIGNMGAWLQARIPVRELAPA